jgi:hypothetical protein
MIIHGIETVPFAAFCRMKIHFQCDDGVMSSASIDLGMPADSSLFLEGLQQAIEMMELRAHAKINDVEQRVLFGKDSDLLLTNILGD